MRLFNTLTQRVEPLRPRGEAVTLYVCGITPYDTTHLGHAFINVAYDTLVRALRWSGQSVRYTQNVTDIDDDILRRAKQVGLPWDELGNRETDRYLTDLRDLNVAMPDHYIRATEVIPQIAHLITPLLRQGLAYERDGWVYFRVRSAPDFGRLAEATGLEGYASWLATANERGNDPSDPRKEDPLDFVLWQAKQPGEPAWPSPWSDGRPGWHIECSTIATTTLGDQIDIHGGGADLIFPHHTCEIAQSEYATGQRPFAQVWMHCAMVGLAGEKMSKSLGNLVLARTLLQRYTPDAVRLLLLAHHYRTPWEYTEDAMQQSAARASALLYAATVAEAGTPGAEDGDAISAQATAEFRAALENDLDTPAALAVLEALAARVVAGETPGGCQTLRALGGVLGLRLDPATQTTPGDATVERRVQLGS